MIAGIANVAMVPAGAEGKNVTNGYFYFARRRFKRHACIHPPET